LAYELWKIGARFAQLAGVVSVVAVFGELLAGPFRAIAGFFFDAANFCWDANETLLDLINLWNQLRWGTLINDVLDRVFWRWHQLRTDPWGFVNDMVRGLFWDWDSFRADPALYIRNRLTGRWPDLGPLFADPVSWLRTRLEYNLGLGVGFFADPLGAIRRWLYERYPILWGLFESPTTWLRSMLTVRMGISTDLLDNPTRWVWERTMDGVERYAASRVDWLVSIAADLINRAWSVRVP
jgi:hypothetical protein